MAQAAILDVFRDNFDDVQDVRRTTDSEREAQKILSSRAARRLGVSLDVLEAHVFKHLMTLMETVRLEGRGSPDSSPSGSDDDETNPFDFSDTPRVRRSILNFGFPELSRVGDPNIDRSVFETTIAEVVANYEPRLVADTIKVSIEPPRAGARVQQRAEVHISAKLLADEAVRMEIDAAIDLAKGCVDTTVDMTSVAKGGRKSQHG